MTSNPRYRWAILLTTLAATLAAVFYPVEEPANRVVSAEPHKRVVTKGIIDTLSAASTLEPSDGSDPFAPRDWIPPQPAAAPPAPAVVPVVVAPVDLTIAKPPELPFRYVGSLVDGAEQTVYLARGDQAFVVKPGDVIDSNYKVLGISATQILFEHVPTGVQQGLAFPAHDN